MTSGFAKEHNLIEKQMGCMAGFLQIFDRHQILTGKRLYSPKRLPSSPIDKSEKSSPTVSMERPNQSPPKSPLCLPIFELKQGNKSSSKEAPRLSLDSRATTDAKGGLHPKEIRTTGNRCDSIVSDGSQHNRSPSVIVRLMGLEPLPNSATTESQLKPELRRSASESRVSRDLFQSRFSADASSFYPRQPTQLIFNNASEDLMKNGNFNSPATCRVPQHRKSFYNSGDVFPEPKQSVSIYGEIEKRLKTRGIDEPSKDLQTLKQILEALQLKGLLHCRRPSEESHRNFVYDESPIVVMKPSRSSTASPRRTNGGNQLRVARRNFSENSQSVSPRQERNARSPIRAGRSTSPTTRNEINTGSRRLVKPKPLTVETQRRLNESIENQRVSSIQSPKPSPRRPGSDPIVNNRSPRSKKPNAEIHHKEKITTVVMAEDEFSSISGCSFTNSTYTEMSKTEEYKEGRSLLERCDKLLSSIAEMNTTDMQPSPVSVLDSSFYKDESSSPSPITTKRNIDFKDKSGELGEEIWSPVISPILSKCEENDSDFLYISDLLRASHYLTDESDLFLLLEKQQYLKGNDTSEASRLQRKLIFDTINEILDRNKQLPPRKANNIVKPSFNKVWLEFQRIRERDIAQDDLFETVCSVLKKDLKGDSVDGWEDSPVEMSEAVLDIERLIFKDLISETIRDLALLASKTTPSSSMLPRRKLVF